MATVRCPNCQSAQPDDARVCASCRASLTDIVVGYADRDALADDRDALESEGWRIAEIKDGSAGAPLAVRYTRLGGEPVKAPSKLVISPLPRWVSYFCLFAACCGLGAVALLARGTMHGQGAVVPTLGPAILSIGGVSGVPFTASLSGIDAGQPVAGKVPQTFTLSPGGAFAGVVNKQSDDAFLITVTVLCPDGSSRVASTFAAFGSVSVAGTCPIPTPTPPR